MKTRFLLAAIPAALLSFTVACDSDSVAIDCTVDTDCPVETPICDPDLLICVAGGEDECAEDLDCQILDGADGAGCEETADCEDPDLEACVEGFNGDGFCVVTGDEAICDLEPGFTSVSLPEKGGGANLNVCVAEDGTCNAGACDL